MIFTSVKVPSETVPNQEGIMLSVFINDTRQKLSWSLCLITKKLSFSGFSICICPVQPITLIIPSTILSQCWGVTCNKVNFQFSRSRVKTFGLFMYASESEIILSSAQCLYLKITSKVSTVHLRGCFVSVSYANGQNWLLLTLIKNKSSVLK